MSRQCTFYYATITESDLDGWPTVGDRQIEPLHNAEGEPIGKTPDYCCEALKEAFSKTSALYASVGGQESKVIFSQIYYSYGAPALHFCPFCGAELIFKEDLKVRAVKSTKVVTSYYFEKMTG